jgi:hypothetical protein
VAVAEVRSHFSPHPPQFSVDVVMSTHESLQFVVVPGHEATQEKTPFVPAAQYGVAPSHFVLQSPHEFLRPREVSQPFARFASQLSKPARQPS